jgi:hypothetical protein
MCLFAALPRLTSAAVLAVSLFLTSARLMADEQDEAEKAAHALAYDQENEGYNIRAEGWAHMLKPKLGKATRMQLYRGNEYCFCVAVPKKSGVHITGAVLDLEGKPAGEIMPVVDGWGFVLFYKPKKTGMHMIAIHETDKGRRREVPVVMVTGYK